MTLTPGTNRDIAIAPSILPADFARLGDAITGLTEQGGVERIHWDVMDGVFVPNMTIGPDVIAATRSLTDVMFEAHLMIVQADALIPAFIDAGCELITVHAEACTHLHRTLGMIKERGAKAAVALNPATSPDAVSQVLDLCDMVLVMTVNPGFGGQRYLDTMERKVATIRGWIIDGEYDCDIQVDGGIGPATAQQAVEAGANVLVAGSAMFRPEGFAASAAAIREAARKARAD